MGPAPPRRRLPAALIAALLLALALPGPAAAAPSPFCRSGSPAVLFAPGGQHVLAYTPLETHVWDLEGRELFHLNGEIWRAISPTGRTIATQRADNTVRLWGLDGRQIAVLTGHAQPITEVLWSPDGRRILTVSAGEMMRLWDASGAPLATMRATEDEPGSPISVAFSADGARLLSAGPGPARLWDRDGHLIASAGQGLGRVSGAAFSPDGTQLIIAGESGSLLTDLGGQPVTSLEASGAPVRTVSFSSDGEHLITTLQDNTSLVWSVRGRQLSSTLGASQFSPDGQTLLTIGEDGTARLRDLSGRALAALWVKGAPMTDATFSPDSQRIMTVGSSGPLRLWDDEGRPLAAFEESSSWGCVLARGAFSPDGTRAVTVGVYRVVQLWDLEQMRSINLQAGSRSWYWLSAINPSLMLSVLGLWVAAVRLRAPEKRRFQSQRTLVAMWPAWAAAHGLAVLVALIPLLPAQLAAGALLSNLLLKVVHGYFPALEPRRWLAAGTLGWIAGWLLGEGLRLALFAGGTYVDTRLVIMPLAGTGLMVGQWYALRGLLPGARWLPVAAAAGWSAASLVTAAEYTTGWLQLALAQGVAAGAVAGAALVWLMLMPESEPE